MVALSERHSHRPGAMTPDAEAVVGRHAEPWRQRLLTLRGLIFDAADRSDVGDLVETLKWGQLAYHPLRAGLGTTVRIDAVPGGEGDCGVFFHCRTTLVEQFREMYGREVSFVGNRLMIVPGSREIDRGVVVHCAAKAFSYHRDRKRLLRR